MTSDPREAEYPHSFMGRPRMCARCGEHDEGLLVEKFNCPRHPDLPKPKPLLEGVGVSTEEVSETLGKWSFRNNQVMELGPGMVVTDNPRRFVHVVFLNGSERWYELDEGGWKIDNQHRAIVIGKGRGRKHIPFDNIEYYSPT